MNTSYILPHPWSIIEEGFDADRVMSSESLFSLGNGAMGQRATFEETYTGATFQGSYIAGVYYPDKTRVGWWKNGYPEYFAKVLNAPSWIGIDVEIDGTPLDLHTCTEVRHFRRELNMKEGIYTRTFEAVLPSGAEVRVEVIRFLSMSLDEVGAIAYSITPLSGDMSITYTPYIDGGITNNDSNWDDKFWEITQLSHTDEMAFIEAHTLKTEFHTCTFMTSRLTLDGKAVKVEGETSQTEKSIRMAYTHAVQKGQVLTLHKFGGYTSGRYHKNDQLVEAATTAMHTATDKGFDGLRDEQIQAWADLWAMSDIQIEGDVSAQQGIRFNIFHLNQTYLGKDPDLNIGPKGFTGEKYGGSTYWDTEAYCLSFYMATKDQKVARSLLEYRYRQLGKAIENAEKLGFTNGAALYPMVTMNGEECHNEWEITFEEIHRNSAIAHAIYNYTRYTEDQSYVREMGIEVLIGIARFWVQRSSISKPKNKFVILGVTGPNEYENNVNNNWYTNYSAKWCIKYMLKQLKKIQYKDNPRFLEIVQKTGISKAEIRWMKTVAKYMYLPYCKKNKVYLQQESFMDKDLIPAKDIPASQRPINQHWSWDRILRSPYIKQADTLQGFFFFEDHFTRKEHKRHFDFYEPLTVHESSLSPCVHSILAAKLDRMDKAYELYLRTSRLDLDDYNKEVEEGLHITSMAGTWMSVVMGFGGLRIYDKRLQLRPRLPKGWTSFAFNINYRGRIIEVHVTTSKTTLLLKGDKEVLVEVEEDIQMLQPNEKKEFTAFYPEL